MALPCNSGLVPINQVWEYGHATGDMSVAETSHGARANSSFWQPKKKDS